MRYAVLLSFVFVLSACKGQKADSIPATVCGEGQQDSNGHICGQGGLWKPMLGGQCHTHLDCPPPYTHCDAATNLCVIRPSASPIVFATDSIQPGATSNSQYAYNIMAKGYDSLNDWCMSQAQQSSIPSMRNIASWKALIIAPPDTSAGITNPQGVSVNNFFSAPPLVFQSPLSTLAKPINFSSIYPAISDKNGNLTTQASNPTWSAWTGLTSSQNYCPALEQQDILCQYSQTGCDDSCHAKYVEAALGCTAGAAVTGSIAAVACEIFSAGACTPFLPEIAGAATAAAAACNLGVTAILTTCHCKNIATQCNQYYGSFTESSNTCDVSTTDSVDPLRLQFSNWGTPLSTDINGVFALTPNSCVDTPSGPGSDSGFILTNDCDSGSYYTSNGSVAKPILCLSQ